MDIPRNASRSIYSVLLYGPAMQICMWIKAKHSQSLVSFSFSIIGRMHAGAAGLQLANRACIHAENRTNLITVFTALCVCVCVVSTRRQHALTQLARTVHSRKLITAARFMYATNIHMQFDDTHQPVSCNNQRDKNRTAFQYMNERQLTANITLTTYVVAVQAW
jgi:hypothetical protein